MSAINLNVKFGHILEFPDGPGEFPGNPWDVVEQSKRMYNADDPSLIVYSMGLRALSGTSLPIYLGKVLASLQELRRCYPKTVFLLQLMGASLRVSI